MGLLLLWLWWRLLLLFLCVLLLGLLRGLLLLLLFLLLLLLQVLRVLWVLRVHAVLPMTGRRWTLGVLRMLLMLVLLWVRVRVLLLRLHRRDRRSGRGYYSWLRGGRRSWSRSLTLSRRLGRRLSGCRLLRRGPILLLRWTFCRLTGRSILL